MLTKPTLSKTKPIGTAQLTQQTSPVYKQEASAPNFQSASPKKELFKQEPELASSTNNQVMNRRKSQQTNIGSHFQSKLDVKHIKAALVEKFGPNYDSIINQEILAAINNLKGSGLPQRMEGKVQKAARLSMAEIEKRVSNRISKKLPNVAKQFSKRMVDSKADSIERSTVAETGEPTNQGATRIEDQMQFLQNQDIGAMGQLPKAPELLIGRAFVSTASQPSRMDQDLQVMSRDAGVESFPNLNQKSIANSIMSSEADYSKRMFNSRNAKGLSGRGGTKELAIQGSATQGSIQSPKDIFNNNRSVKNNARYAPGILNTSLEQANGHKKIFLGKHNDAIFQQDQEKWSSALKLQSPSQVSPRLKKILQQQHGGLQTQTQASILNKHFSIDEPSTRNSRLGNASVEGVSRRHKHGEGVASSIPATPMSHFPKESGGNVTAREGNLSSVKKTEQKYIQGIIDSIIAKPTATQNLLHGSISSKLKHDIQADVSGIKDQTQNTSATLRSSLLPFSFNISPIKQHFNDSNTQMGTRDLKTQVHDTLQDTQAKGIFQSFAPTKLNSQRKAFNSQETHQFSEEDLSAKKVNKSKKEKSRKLITNRYDREDNQSIFKSIKKPKQGSPKELNAQVLAKLQAQDSISKTSKASKSIRVQDRLNRSVAQDSQSHYPVDPDMSQVTERSAHFFDLDNTVNGPAVGGPAKKSNITMWDMMALYDSQKKRIEDEQKFVQFKQQQQNLKDFYHTQMDFKQQLRNMETEEKKKDLEQLKKNHQTLNEYEKDFQATRRNYYTKISNENKNRMIAHKRMQTLQFRDTENSINDKYSLGQTHLTQSGRMNDGVSSFKKKSLLVDQRQEIEAKKRMLSQKQQQDLMQNRRDLDFRDNECQERDDKLADHNDRIARRDQAIYNIYSSPQHMTHSKQEMHKTMRVNQLNDALLQKAIEKEKLRGEKKLKRKLDMLQDMIDSNSQARAQQKYQIHHKKALRDQEKMLRGNVGRAQQYTGPQVAQNNDQHLKKAVQNLQAKRYMLELEQQIQDKKLREESQRLYLDQKQLATSGTIMKAINPHLFHARAGSTERLIEDKHYLDHECKKMNDISLAQYFLPTQLRSQRFKD